MKAKEIKTQTAYRIVTDKPVAVVVGFKPHGLHGYKYDEFECTDTTEGKGGPDDTVFITTLPGEGSVLVDGRVGQMTIMSGRNVGLWLIKEDGKLGDRLQSEPKLEVIRHPDQWTEFARMLEGEDELVLKAFHVSTTIATGEHITSDNVEEFIHDAMEDIVEKFGASATNSVVAEIGKVSTPHDKESEEESVWEHVDTIVDGMDQLLARHNAVAEVERQAEKEEADAKRPGPTKLHGMVQVIEEIRTLINNGVQNQLKTQECPRLLDEITNVMRSYGYKVDGGE